MFPYWAVLLTASYFTVKGATRKWMGWQCWLIGLALTVFVGFRHEVGGDWFNYIPYVTRAAGLTYAEVLKWGDPGYNFLNWLFSGYSWGIYGVNVVSAAVFSAGLVWFCKEQPRPWLALTIAIPYLVIVVAMGYIRQGVAIGLIMPGLIALERERLWRFVAWISVAATFHSTALVMLAFVIPAIPGKALLYRALRLLAFIAASGVLVATFLASRYETLVNGYIENEYTSEGFRLEIHLKPAFPCIYRIPVTRFLLHTLTALLLNNYDLSQTLFLHHHSIQFHLV